MKKLYFACNFDAAGKPGFPDSSCMYAAVVDCTDADNLIDFFERFRKMGIKTANLMPSKKAAKALCDAWNETYKAQGVCAWNW